VANFKTKDYFEPEKIKRFLNAVLPRDIAIKECKQVPLTFHARFSAKGKSYIYKVYTHPDPFMFQRAWFISQNLDLKKINDAINLVKCTKNLISMSKRGEYLREDIELREFKFKYNGFLLEFEISASHFLRYMVRKLVAHVIHVGTGRLDLNVFKEILNSQNPAKALFIAPPEGLYLKEVYYLPEDEEL
jgi:tRNA pseudouridine38-40 synthase